MNDMRFERKFVARSAFVDEVIEIVLTNPACFSEIYQSRWVNNIYFDSADMVSYRSGVEGQRDRFKTRLRWYGERYSAVAKPVLEIKSKQGLLGGKKRFTVTDFDMHDCCSPDDLVALAGRGEIAGDSRELLSCLYPTLLNRYKRRYYISGDGRYRLTIDNYMDYCDPAVFNTNWPAKTYSRSPQKVIIEIKYAPDEDNDLKQITSHLPYRLSKSSKYIDGIQQTMFL